MIALSNIPTHQLAQFMLQTVREALAFVGLSDNTLLEEAVYTALVIAVALSFAWIVRMLILFVVGRLKVLRGRYSHWMGYCPLPLPKVGANWLLGQGRKGKQFLI